MHFSQVLLKVFFSSICRVAASLIDRHQFRTIHKQFFFASFSTPRTESNYSALSTATFIALCVCCWSERRYSIKCFRTTTGKSSFCSFFSRFTSRPPFSLLLANQFSIFHCFSFAHCVLYPLGCTDRENKRKTRRRHKKSFFIHKSIFFTFFHSFFRTEMF